MFKENDVVILDSMIQGVPARTLGVVVFVYANQKAYEVEFQLSPKNRVIRIEHCLDILEKIRLLYP